MIYEPGLPFCGRGSPCGNLPLQRRYEELRAEGARHPSPVLESDNARKRWHKDHKDHKAKGRPGLSTSPRQEVTCIP